MPFPAVPTSASKVLAKVLWPRQEPAGIGRAWVEGVLRGPAERGLMPSASRARLPQSHKPSANMVLFSRGGRALGQAWILLSIASPCRPWGTRTCTSQAKSAWNPFYEAPGAVCVCACGSSGVCLCKSLCSSFIPCYEESRGDPCSVTTSTTTLSHPPYSGMAASCPQDS